MKPGKAEPTFGSHVVIVDGYHLRRLRLLGKGDKFFADRRGEEAEALELGPAF
jgi:hypothetical protein